MSYQYGYADGYGGVVTEPSSPPVDNTWFLTSTVVWPTDRPDWKQRPRPQRTEGRAIISIGVSTAAYGTQVQSGRATARLAVTAEARHGRASARSTVPVAVRAADPKVDDREAMALLHTWLAIQDEDARAEVQKREAYLRAKASASKEVTLWR